MGKTFKGKDKAKKKAQDAKRKIARKCKGACVLAFLLMMFGCKQQNIYTEGTNLMIGIYVPTAEGLIGLQAIDYLSGVKVSTQTNLPFSVKREFCSSNSYFGVVHTAERVKTKIEVDHPKRATD